MTARTAYRARLRAGAIAGLSVGVLGGLGCGDRPADSPPPGGDRADPPRPTDSLVATASNGTQIWFTLARTVKGDDGECVDRAIEIRRNGTRVPVPLLYTGSHPRS